MQNVVVPKKYYLPKLFIKHYNVIVNQKNFYYPFFKMIPGNKKVSNKTK